MANRTDIDEIDTGDDVRIHLTRPVGVFSCMVVALAGAAHAHHPGGGGNSGSGGAINTISADTLAEGQAAASVRYEYIKLGNLGDADLLAAASQGKHGHSLGSIDSVSLSAAYGITNDLMFSVRLPGVRRSDIREAREEPGLLSGGHMDAGQMSSLMSSDGVNARGNASGFGDISVLGQYRFHNNAQTGTSAAVLFGFKAPTGSTSQRDANGELFEAEFQPGSGSWDALLGAAFTKRLGRWSFDVSGLYWLVGNGTQDTNLGDRFLFGAGMSYRLVGAIGSSKEVELHEYCMQRQNQMHEHCLYHANHDHSDMKKTPYTLDLVLELNGEWHDKQRIAGIRGSQFGRRHRLSLARRARGFRSLLEFRVRRRAGHEPAQRRSVQARLSRAHGDQRAAELKRRPTPEETSRCLAALPLGCAPSRRADVAENLPVSVSSCSDCDVSWAAALRTRVAAASTLLEASRTPVMFCITSWAPCAACCTLRAISLVAAPCCSTAAAIEPVISFICPIVVPISRMALTVEPVASRIS